MNDVLCRFQQYFNHIKGTAHIIHVFPGVHQHLAGPLRCLAQEHSEEKSKRTQCGSNLGPLDYGSNTFSLSHAGSNVHGINVWFCHIIFQWLIDWLIVLGFNATWTAKVISWRSVTHMCFLAFSHQHLNNFSFQSHDYAFLTCFCRGERRKYAGKKVRLNRGSNSQPPGHESVTLTTEPPGWGSIFQMSSSFSRNADELKLLRVTRTGFELVKWMDFCCQKLLTDQRRVQSKIWLHVCAGWSCSTLSAK